MKKIMWLVVTACMTLSLAVSAQTSVYSGNVVGFTRITIPANKLAIIGVPFNAVGTNLTLLGLFGTNQLKPGGSVTYTAADQVWLWNKASNAYAPFALKNTDWQFHSANAQWGGAATNPVIYPGDAMWVRLSATTPEKTITLAGQVVDASVATNAISIGAQFRAFPYSASTKLKDSDLLKSGMKTGGAVTYTTADQLWTWDSTGAVYRMYALCKIASPPSTNWYTCNANWNKPAGLSDDVVVDIGKGFWLRANSNWNWVVTNGYLGSLQ